MNSKVFSHDEWQQWLKDNVDYINKMREQFQKDGHYMPPPGNYPIEGEIYISFINMGTQQKPAWIENVYNVLYIRRVSYPISAEGVEPMDSSMGFVDYYQTQMIKKRITHIGHEEYHPLWKWDDEGNRRGRYFIGIALEKGGVASDLGDRFLNWNLKNPWEVKE